MSKNVSKTKNLITAKTELQWRIWKARKGNVNG